MKPPLVNIHTHRPTGHSIELRTAGVHPWAADHQSAASIVPLLDRAQAVGEIGLDFACRTDRAAQYTLLREQLRMAVDRGLPVVLHCVRAFGEVMGELAACEPRAVIFHGFIGSPAQARQALLRGYYLSFGQRTFASPRTLAALREVPLNRLFLETDDSEAPIEQIYARIAQARELPVEELQAALFENYKRIFTTNG